MLLIENVPNATPLDDISGLIPTHISTRLELNEWEAANILQAAGKYLAKKKQLTIDPTWIKKAHKDMFGETWEWAGKFRQRNYNLGADWHLIPEQVKLLADDIVHWKKAKDAPDILKQSVRIHHRLVKIHPFVNGNGRHARLVSDIFLYHHDHKLPQWPDQALLKTSDTRERYITALQEADKGNYKPLESFTAERI